MNDVCSIEFGAFRPVFRYQCGLEAIGQIYLEGDDRIMAVHTFPAFKRSGTSTAELGNQKAQREELTVKKNGEGRTEKEERRKWTFRDLLRIRSSGEPLKRDRLSTQTNRIFESNEFHRNESLWSFIVLCKWIWRIHLRQWTIDTLLDTLLDVRLNKSLNRVLIELVLIFAQWSASMNQEDRTASERCWRTSCDPSLWSLLPYW